MNVSPNALPERDDDVAERIAQQTLAKRGPDYAGEVRLLLDVGLEVMRKNGTSSRPRVADIVAAAGLSNDAFYRHFSSKDALVAAILEDGAERLGSYLAHQMAKERTPEGKVRRWVEGVLSQADGAEIASATLAVLWNAGTLGAGMIAGPASAEGPLATLLRDPFADLGSVDPDLDASLTAHAVVGKLADYLWKGARPKRVEIERIVTFCLGAVRRTRHNSKRKTR